MASGDSLFSLIAISNLAPDWLFVAFTSGSTEPTADGDGTAVIWGDTSDATARLEYLVLTGGSWGGNDAAGYMLLSNWNGTAWSSGENFTADSGTPANHGTLTSVPVACFATLDVRNNKPVLDFDATVNELAKFQCLMPLNYDGSGLTLTVSVMASSATTNDMSFAAFIMSVTAGADDLDVKNFADPQVNQAIDAPGTSGQTVDFAITFSNGAQMDNVAAGEWFYLLLMRDAQDSTNDDMAGDAELVGIAGKET